SCSQRPSLPYTTLFRSAAAELTPLASEWLMDSSGWWPPGRPVGTRPSRDAGSWRAAPPRRAACSQQSPAARSNRPEVAPSRRLRSEEHTSELQSPDHLV